MEIKITRSHRRRKTVSARLAKDMLLVSAPVFLAEHKLQEIVAQFKTKFERKAVIEGLNADHSLQEMAARINRDYFNNGLCISSIAYVGNQTSKFGCCNYTTGRIRISHKVSTMPAWVREYVVLHELAHLQEPNHSSAFWHIVNRYALTERARGYLMAAGIEAEEG